jgi:hypothetical protein
LALRVGDLSTEREQLRPPGADEQEAICETVGEFGVGQLLAQLLGGDVGND